MKTTVWNEEHDFPLVVEAERPMDHDEFFAWLAADRDEWGQLLLRHGALLFRGFGIDSQEVFGRFSKVANPDLLEYVDGNSPRTQLGGGIYTSTEYPPEYFISLHNELSYAAHWPMNIYFCCVTPPAEGGETPLVKSRTLLDRLDPAIVAAFRDKGVAYIRNLHGGRGFGASWQKTFQLETPEELEAYAKASDINLEWHDKGVARLVAKRPALREHPETGEELWFNQADQFHPTTHPPAIYESMMKLYAGREDQIPQTATFGDGSPIDPAMLNAIRDTTRQLMVRFSWRQGDLLVADNMLVAHGRMPFSGPRKIIVDRKSVV